MILGYSIAFPKLGIVIEQLNKSFEIGGFRIAYYGVLIGLGILAGMAMVVKVAKSSGQDVEIYYDCALYAISFSLLGARIYYVIFEWDYYKENLLSIFKLREGGMAIYGAVIAAVSTLFVYARRKKLSLGLLLDTGCIGLITGQIIGRWGNFVNREAFGGYTEGLFAMQLKKSEVYSGYITPELAENTVWVNGIEYIQVHPTFLYEALWNLGLLVALLLYRHHKRFDGEVACCYLIGYGLGRAWIEGLRTDQLMLGDFAVSQVLSVLLVIGAVGFVILNRKMLKKETVNKNEKNLKTQD